MVDMNFDRISEGTQLNLTYHTPLSYSKGLPIPEKHITGRPVFPKDWSADHLRSAKCTAKYHSSLHIVHVWGLEKKMFMDRKRFADRSFGIDPESVSPN